MNVKNFVTFPAESKSANFSTEGVDTERDIYTAFAVTTTAESSLNVSLQLEVSLDGSNWAAEGSPTAVTSNTTTIFDVSENPFTFARITSTFSAGSATFAVRCQTKGF